MKVWVLRGFVGAVVVASVLAALLLVRTALVRAEPVPGGEPHPFPVAGEAAVERLAGAIRFPTVVPADRSEGDPGPWIALHRHLEAAFPRVHGALARDTVAGLSFLYRWEGTDRELAPILLAAHMDVAPAGESSPEGWTHPPFSGAVADGFVWGRGTLRGKAPLIAILEAVEGLLDRGFVPRRTLLLAVSHDGAAGGGEGTRALARRLEAEGVRPAWALSEGLGVMTEVAPGLRDPAGLVGVAERGALTLRLEARGEAAHPALPPAGTAVGRLARALARLEEEPFEPRVRGATRELLTTLAPHLDPGSRMLLANLWLLERPVARALTERPAMAAVLRTTTAPGTLRIEDAGALLSPRAEARVHVGLVPWDDPGDIMENLRARFADLEVEVSVEEGGLREAVPPPRASSGGEGFLRIREALHRTFPDVIAVAPALAPLPTEARRYAGVVRDAYRFAPLRFDGAAGERVHGADERIRVTDYLAGIRFYGELIRRATE